MIAILCLVPFIGQAQELQAPFAHPGLNHSRADLERMKEKVLGKEKPWIDGWDALCAFRDAQSDFKASPKPSLGGTDGTRQRASRDAMAAYYNILRWYVTGDEAHARCAVDILNAWSASVQSVVTGELYMLPACEFMEAAELVRLYPGWKAEDVERKDGARLHLSGVPGLPGRGGDMARLGRSGQCRLPVHWDFLG